MTQKRPFFIGNIRISDLNGFEDTVKNNVRGCFIPYDANPSLFIGQNRTTGAITVDMDILIREVQSSKSGSSHFIKLNVGKANRERFQMSQEAIDSLRIVGNLYTKVPGQGKQQRGAIAAPQGQAWPQGGQYQRQPVYQPQQGMYPAGGYVPRPQDGFAGGDDLPAGDNPGWK